MDDPFVDPANVRSTNRKTLETVMVDSSMKDGFRDAEVKPSMFRYIITFAGNDSQFEKHLKWKSNDIRVEQDGAIYVSH